MQIWKKYLKKCKILHPSHHRKISILEIQARDLNKLRIIRTYIILKKIGYYTLPTIKIIPYSKYKLEILITKNNHTAYHPLTPSDVALILSPLDINCSDNLIPSKFSVNVNCPHRIHRDINIWSYTQVWKIHYGYMVLILYRLPHLRNMKNVMYTCHLI